MGGDDAPRVTVGGAVEAARAGLPVTLVGREPDLRTELSPGACSDAGVCPERGKRTAVTLNTSRRTGWDVSMLAP